MSLKFRSPNFSVRMLPIRAIVVHITDCPYQIAHNTVMNSHDQASYHFMLDDQEKVVQYVDPNLAAWHAGSIKNPTILLEVGVNPNQYTVGIAASGYAKDGYSISKLLALVGLCVDCCKSFNIKPDESTIIFHREIRSDKTCPGPIDKKLFLQLVKIIYKL